MSTVLCVVRRWQAVRRTSVDNGVHTEMSDVLMSNEYSVVCGQAMAGRA